MYVSVGEEYWNLDAIARIAPGARGTWNVWLVSGERITLPPVKGTCLHQEIEGHANAHSERGVNRHHFMGRDFYHSTIDESGDAYDETIRRYS